VETLSCCSGFLIHGDVHLGPDVRIFRSVDERAWRMVILAAHAPTLTRTFFDVHQGFVDAVQHLGQDDSITWRVGSSGK